LAHVISCAAMKHGYGTGTGTETDASTRHW